MDHDIAYEVEDEAQFWQEIEDITHPASATIDAVKSTVNNFISFVAQFGADYLPRDSDVESCCVKLLESDFFRGNTEQVRTAMIEYKPELDKIAKCYVNLYLLLLDARQHSRTFKLMRRAQHVPAMAQLAKDHYKDSPRLTKLALTIMFEMCRMQKLPESDMSIFDEEYVWFLLRLVENANDDDDPYAFRPIKLIISLNEQFMVAALPQAQQPFSRSGSNTSLAIAEEKIVPSTLPQNTVIKLLSSHGARFKSFGENLIRMLNRERDTALQLLILKQLFLLFTNSATYDYFYTNDLHVLVDVFIRELYNLSNEDEALRHTYLRVLHPLLTHTELRHPPFYKGPELVKLLNSLNQECSHFGPVGATTVRLLARCLTVPWLLPPRRRKLKLPRPGFPDRKKSSKMAIQTPTSQAQKPDLGLGMSLQAPDRGSQVSLHSIDSVNSIAKVRPPTTPRVKMSKASSSSSSSSAAASPAPTTASTLAVLPPLCESVVAQHRTIDSTTLPDGRNVSSTTRDAKTEDLLREMSRLELAT